MKLHPKTHSMKRKFLTVTPTDTHRQRRGTMAPPSFPQYLLLSLWLVFNMTCCIADTDSDVQNIRGEVGGNVTIHCPHDKQKTTKFFYFQKDMAFVNGYHVSKPTKDGNRIQTWENTRVEDKTTVHMTNLNVSHSGYYKCIIKYSDNNPPSETYVDLHITANYSKPEVSVKCSDGLSCLATCASHGGYPGTEMKWSVPGGQIWKVVNSSQMPNPVTMLINSSSTAYFNCSNGELEYLSCYVGDVMSEMFSVCTREVPPDPPSPYVIPVAICAVAIFTLSTGLLLFWKYNKSRIRAVAGNGRQVNRSQEEVIQLSTNQEGEKAP